MASPRIFAAAACLLLSGLVVGGAGASLAFADPDAGNGGSSNGGDSNGSGSDGHSRPGFGFGFGQRPGASSGGGSVDAPNTIGNPSPGDFGVRLPTRSGSLIGDGRNGRVGILPKSGGSAQSGGAAPPSGSLPPVAGEPSTGPSAAVPPVVSLPPITTGIAVAPPSAPSSAVPTAPQAGDGNGGTASRGWWPSSRLPQAGPVDDQVSAAVPQLPRVQLPIALPAEVLSTIDRIADNVAGLATAAAALPFASMSLPVVVPPLGAAGGATDHGGRTAAGGGAAARIPPSASLDGAPTITGKVGTPQDPPRPKASQPFEADSVLASEMTYRAGYDDYLRAAGVGKVAAVAVPGVGGILLLTGAGGLIGYRQARAGSAVRSSGPGRFMS